MEGYANTHRQYSTYGRECQTANGGRKKDGRGGSSFLCERLVSNGFGTVYSLIVSKSGIFQLIYQTLF